MTESEYLRLRRGLAPRRPPPKSHPPPGVDTVALVGNAFGLAVVVAGAVLALAVAASALGVCGIVLLPVFAVGGFLKLIRPPEPRGRP